MKVRKNFQEAFEKSLGDNEDVEIEDDVDDEDFDEDIDE